MAIALRSLKILAILALAIGLGAPAPASAGVDIGVGISVNFGPPALPVYVQPPCPAPNYIWTPGFWAWGPAGYFWVPGTWVAAPRPGYLWTPGYWGYGGGAYAWHPGYWGTHIGFYGGVNYGFGYFGAGYVGGGWHGNAFHYNTAVTNVNTTIVRNVYVNKTVVNNYNTINRVSYNGGPHGIAATPTPQERSYMQEQHVPMTRSQNLHVQTASRDRNFLASVNDGRPQTAAVAKPLSRLNRPVGYAPVKPQDRAAVPQYAHPHTVPAYTAEHPSNTGYAHPANAGHPPAAHPQNYAQPHPPPHTNAPPPPHANGGNHGAEHNEHPN